MKTAVYFSPPQLSQPNLFFMGEKVKVLPFFRSPVVGKSIGLLVGIMEQLHHGQVDLYSGSYTLSIFIIPVKPYQVLPFKLIMWTKFNKTTTLLDDLDSIRKWEWRSREGILQSMFKGKIDVKAESALW